MKEIINEFSSLGQASGLAYSESLGVLFFNETNNMFGTIGAVDPNIASAFSAITGLYTISSNMHPIYGKDEFINMKIFLAENI